MHTTTKLGTRNAERGTTAGHRSPLRTPHSALRTAFTLTELLIVITIIGIMTGLGLSAIAGATEQAREQRTRSIIAKLDQLIMERYESYRTRAVPIRIPSVISGTTITPRMAARYRLYALRDLMRMEMPDRASDIIDDRAQLSSTPPVKLSNPPALWRTYRRQAARAMGTSWNTTWLNSDNESSECLYLIISTIQDGDKNALDFFTSDEIGDTDGNGMKEILDSWGQPIAFLRWAPGFTLENGAITNQTSEYTTTTSSGNNYRDCVAPDLFDPLKADPRWQITGTPAAACFALRPLIMSGGRDKIYGVNLRPNPNTNFSGMTPPNDPYFGASNSDQVGYIGNSDAFPDNISNHDLRTP